MAKPATDKGEPQFVRRVLIVLGLASLFLLAWLQVRGHFDGMERDRTAPRADE